MLKGDMVILRSPVVGDAEALSEYLRDREVFSALQGSVYPVTEQDMRNFIFFISDRTVPLSEINLTICLHDGTVIGMCALHDFTKRGTAQIGFWLGRRHWGHGYAREAVALVSRMALERLGVKRLYAVSAASNSRSERTLSSLGFKKVRAGPGGKDLIKMVLTR